VTASTFCERTFKYIEVVKQLGGGKSYSSLLLQSYPSRTLTFTWVILWGFSYLLGLLVGLGCHGRVCLPSEEISDVLKVLCLSILCWCCVDLTVVCL
jgi:hypothetical protein